MEFEVDVYVDGSYVRSKRVFAHDPEHAEELVFESLVIEFDVNEVE